jgi:hypothetical protein
MFKIIVYADGMECTRFVGDDLYDVVLKLNIFREKDFIDTFTYSFELFYNDKVPSNEVWKEYHDMLYKLIPLAKKMAKMGEDF